MSPISFLTRSSARDPILHRPRGPATQGLVEVPRRIASSYMPPEMCGASAWFSTAARSHRAVEALRRCLALLLRATSFLLHAVELVF